MMKFVRSLFAGRAETTGFVFSRPLVVIQSDDWGRVGLRDHDGYESLRAKGINLGEERYDLYSFETAEDVNALASMLLRHRDAVGRSPCVVMNFCTANLHFEKMKTRHYKHLELLPLAKGLPGSWSRPGLFEAYRAGIREGIFYPALHSLTHFCPVAAENVLAQGGPRAEFLLTLWENETPYIYWRMPWIGYEYWNPEKPHAGFLSSELQRTQIKKASECFFAMFEMAPVSACAPGYMANRDTRRAWAEVGIRVAQNGAENGLNAPYIDKTGLLHLHRTIDLEPSHHELEIAKYVELASNYFSRGLPVIISTHSINFHSTLQDFRTPTLEVLDSLLTALESKYTNLLYVHDQDLYRIVTEGVFDSREERVPVLAKQEWNRRTANLGVS